MRGPKRRLVKLGLMGLCGALTLCGTTGAAAVYVSGINVLGPSSEAVNGFECKTVASTKTRDSDGLWVRQFIVAEKADDLGRLRTALRVAESIRKAQSPHLVQVSVLDPNGPTTLSGMRGRAIGAQVTIIPNPSTDLEKQAGTYSGFSMQGMASDDGEFHGIRLDAVREDIEAMASGLKELKGCVGDPAAKAATASAES